MRATCDRVRSDAGSSGSNSDAVTSAVEHSHLVVPAAVHADPLLAAFHGVHRAHGATNASGQGGADTPTEAGGRHQRQSERHRERPDADGVLLVQRRGVEPHGDDVGGVDAGGRPHPLAVVQGGPASVAEIAHQGGWRIGRVQSGAAAEASVDDVAVGGGGEASENLITQALSRGRGCLLGERQADDSRHHHRHRSR